MIVTRYIESNLDERRPAPVVNKGKFRMEEGGYIGILVSCSIIMKHLGQVFLVSVGCGIFNLGESGTRSRSFGLRCSNQLQNNKDHNSKRSKLHSGGSIVLWGNIRRSPQTFRQL